MHRGARAAMKLAAPCTAAAAFIVLPLLRFSSSEVSLEMRLSTPCSWSCADSVAGGSNLHGRDSRRVSAHLDASQEGFHFMYSSPWAQQL